MRQLLAAALFFFALASGACAEVTLTFYSHHFGTYGFGVTFPHAHVALSGTTGADAKPVKANFGFTADTISPSILWGSVEGACRLDARRLHRDEPAASFAPDQ